MEIENRLFSRIPSSGPMNICSRTEPMAESAEVVNLSVHGLEFRATGARLTKGEIYFLEFDLAGEGEAIWLPAELVWVSDADGDGVCRGGFEFQHLDDAVCDFIKAQDAPILGPQFLPKAPENGAG
jgi:hypothetical protein